MRATVIAESPRQFLIMEIDVDALILIVYKNISVSHIYLLSFLS